MLSTATESGALWPSFIYGEWPPLQGLSVKSLDGALHIFFIGQLDEAEPSGFTRHLVTDDACGNDLKPSIGHEFAEYVVGYTAGKVSHE